MNKMPLIIAGLLVLGIVAWFFFKKKNKSETHQYFISTQSESDARVKKLNLDKASEDASYILDTNKLSLPKNKMDFGNITYEPDPEREWIINIRSSSGAVLKKDDLWKIFDKDWRTSYSSAEVYGYSPEEKRWAYVIAGGTPEYYDKIKVGVDLLEVYKEDPAYNPEKLKNYLTELQKKVRAYPIAIEIQPAEPIDKAIEKSKLLVEQNHEFNQAAIIVLKNDKPFKGLLVWDVLLSAGLKWGDGDLFHWSNNAAVYGDDQFFSVWTTTDPGYFLPESIQKNQMNPNDLVFGFSIPRSADPENIFEIMINTVKYCQKRLSGKIFDKNGQPFDEVKERKYLMELIDKMKVKGISPGSDKALRMYS